MKTNCPFSFSDTRFDPDEGGAEEGDLQVERDVPVPGDGQREEQGQLRLPQPGIHHEGVHQQGMKRIVLLGIRESKIWLTIMKVVWHPVG